MSAKSKSLSRKRSVPEPPTIDEILNLSRKVPLAYRLDKVDRRTDEDTGEVLPVGMRQLFNLLCNISGKIQALRDRLYGIATELVRSRSKQGCKDKETRRKEAALLREAIACETEAASLGLQLQEPFIVFSSLLNEAFPKFDRAAIYMVKTGYRLFRLTLDSRLPWVKLVPKNQRHTVATVLRRQQIAPETVTEELAMAMVDEVKKVRASMTTGSSPSASRKSKDDRKPQALARIASAGQNLESGQNGIETLNGFQSLVGFIATKAEIG